MADLVTKMWFELSVAIGAIYLYIQYRLVKWY